MRLRCRSGGPVRIARAVSFVLGASLVLLTSSSAFAKPDYSKRAMPISDSVRTALIGRWTNPVDNLVIEISSVDPVTGEVRGREWPTTPFRPDSSPAGTEHDLAGWVSGAPPKPGLDNVTPVTFATTLFEYGTLPVWAGYLRDGKITTMHYLVWPNRTYPWDHISALEQIWTKLP